jgi:hypothetical protein
MVHRACSLQLPQASARNYLPWELLEQLEISRPFANPFERIPIQIEKHCGRNGHIATACALVPGVRCRRQAVTQARPHRGVVASVRRIGMRPLQNSGEHRHHHHDQERGEGDAQQQRRKLGAIVDQHL